MLICLFEQFEGVSMKDEGWVLKKVGILFYISYQQVYLRNIS
jgi:hypothetical protein